MTEKALTSTDSELGHCLRHLPMFISIQAQDHHHEREFLFSTDSELLQLQRQGLANHRFRCMVVPEVASVQAVNLSHFEEGDEEF